MKTLITAFTIGTLLLGTELRISFAADEAKLLFNGPGKKVIGFVPNGTLLTYVDALQSFFLYDLSRTANSGPGWKSPDQGKLASGTLNPDGTRVALVFEAGKDQSRIRLCNSITGALLKPDFKMTDVGYVAFSSDGKKLAGVCPMNGTVRLWDASTGESLDSMSWAEPMQVMWSGIEFSPDGKRLAARNSYAYAIWNLATRRVSGTSRMPDLYLAINSQWTLTLAVLASETPKEALQGASLFDLANPGKPVPVSKRMSEALDWIAFSPDGTLAAVATTNKTIRIWNVNTDEVRQPVIQRKASVLSMAISPDNRFLAVYEWVPTKGAARDRSRTVRIVDVQTGDSRSSTEEFNGIFPRWHFDKESKFMVVSAFGDADTVTQIWQLPSNKTKPGSPK